MLVDHSLSASGIPYRDHSASAGVADSHTARIEGHSEQLHNTHYSRRATFAGYAGYVDGAPYEVENVSLVGLAPVSSVIPRPYESSADS